MKRNWIISVFSTFQIPFPFLLIGAISLNALTGCSSGPQVKRQAYAELSNERTFESEFPAVWKGIEEALRNHRIKERNPSEVDAQEMRKIKERSLETDWIYGQSRDKYQEYKVNGFPKKVYLQTRFRYRLEAKKVMGGVHVDVKTDEEVERLNDDGTPRDYVGVDSADSSRASELLDRIQRMMLSL